MGSPVCFAVFFIKAMDLPLSATCGDHHCKGFLQRDLHMTESKASVKDHRAVGADYAEQREAAQLDEGRWL